ncbi:MAG: nucleotidyltransferase domain-containing protein [Candidatus Woesearchaeota archaeon]
MESKQTTMQELFFNHPAKHWHFEEILEQAKISRGKAASWLKTLTKQRLIIRIKEKGKMPYYVSSYESPEYQNQKRLSALNRLHECGLLNYLKSLKGAKTVILFGGFSRWDWHKDSDIDIFIYGSPGRIEVGRYESRLHRDIQLFIGKGKSGLRKFSPELLRNIINGNVIKGSIPLEMIKDAAV